ncbi:uncharacterized mitochondrial protein-like protein, partial [Tanacetum coccineum]
SGLVSLTTARPVNIVQPKTIVNCARPMTNVNTVKDINVNAARPKAVVNTVKPKAVLNAVKGNHVNAGNPQMDLQDQGLIDSECSRHMTRNMSYLTDFEEIDRGYVAYGGNPKGGKITSRATKDETSGILKSFITGFEYLIDQRVKIIRCDNGTEFKNKEMNRFCERKCIKREFSVARTPQQNGVAERKNRTLIEAARTMLADFKLHTTFWAEAVNTACYVKLEWRQYLENITFCYHYGNAGTKVYDDSGDDEKNVTEYPKEEDNVNNTNNVNNVSSIMSNSTNNVNAASINEVNAVGAKTSIELLDDLNILELEDIVYSDDDEDVGAKADMNNLDTFMYVSPILTTRIHKDHPVEQIIRDLNSVPQTRRMTKNLEEHGLKLKQKKDGIFISQDKYVTEILKKFGFTDVKTASTPMETQKILLKDEDGEEVDVHLYRSMIGLLMYLTSSRTDIMFAVCACARYQVNPRVSHLHIVKRKFRYLKGQPKLGLWFLKDSPFDLVAYTDSDYAGASLDRKSTIGGCQFLRSRLISRQ